MLDHLDSILTFSPNLQVAGETATNGQFDDADDEEVPGDETATHAGQANGNGHLDPAMDEEGH